MRVLVVNTGSSSIKLSLVADSKDVVDSSEVPWDSFGTSLSAFVASTCWPDAIGHRIVHGGEIFHEPAVFDDEVAGKLATLKTLAPLHQSLALDAAEISREVLAGVTAVACFDTAFFSTLSPAASTYAIPEQWRSQFGIRRFGFHGLSHQSVARRVGAWIGTGDQYSEPVRLVSCHIGAGASVAGILGCEPVDTSMGFTPLEGLVMATRSGSLDPGIILHLLSMGIAPDLISEGLQHKGGLFALTGTPDLKVVLERATAGDPDCIIARDCYVWRLRATIGSMVASLGGLDVLAFTGGAGERSSELRERVCAGLDFIGVDLDTVANQDANSKVQRPIADIGKPGARARAVVASNGEQIEIARQVEQLLG